MEESRTVDRLDSKVIERKGYQALIILVLDGHVVWWVARDTTREIIFIALRPIGRVADAYGIRESRMTIDNMVNGHIKSKRRQHLDKMNDETAVASASEVVYASGVATAERISYTGGSLHRST